MRLAPLFALSLAGCTLYFGPDDPRGIAPLPGNPPPVGVKPGSGPNDPGGPLSARCGAPEVHVIGVYETSSNHNTVGTAEIKFDRPGDHILVLSAYEATRWQVRPGPRTTIRAVQLIGYEDQTVELPNVPVMRSQGCGYSWPYNGQGCDTNALLAAVKAHTSKDITTFHGCYQASLWTVREDGTATSNCSGSTSYEMRAECGQTRTWEPFTFQTLTPATCSGPRFVRHDERYNAWVGAIRCGAANRYKLYMSPTRNEPFLEIADFGGHGQDHCELVNPAFRIIDDDDIRSGGCTSCEIGGLVDVDGVPVFARSRFGEPFERVQARYWADLTTTFYSCGVSIP
jgi:hypothetical protein